MVHQASDFRGIDILRLPIADTQRHKVKESERERDRKEKQVHQSLTFNRVLQKLIPDVNFHLKI